MKYLFLMGGSGCGKTTAAKNLELFEPEIFHRVLEISTRGIRDGEKKNFDYKFFTNEEFEKCKDSLFEKVEYQFGDYKYGAEYSELKENVWNILVVSMEGFLSAVKNIKATDKTILINILLDEKPFTDREDRKPDFEENYNLAVLNSFLKSENILEINGKSIKYSVMKISQLKTMGTNSNLLVPYFKGLIESYSKGLPLKLKIKQTEAYNDLLCIFMENSDDILNSLEAQDCLDFKAGTFGKTVKEVCDDSLKILREAAKLHKQKKK